MVCVLSVLLCLIVPSCIYKVLLPVGTEIPGDVCINLNEVERKYSFSLLAFMEVFPVQKERIQDKTSIKWLIKKL